ncbi:MAG: methyltransferase domain-containing protein [archaeon]|nr:methyltransferase domain-containing protein [archaeon]
MQSLENENWLYLSRKHLIHLLVTKFAMKIDYMIDVGCGNGMILHSFSNIEKRIGIETHPLAVSNAREKGLTIMDSIRETPDQADLVLLMDVIEHVPDDVTFLKEVLAKLSSDGKAIITVPAFQWLWSIHDEKVHHFRRYSKKSLNACIQKAGGKVDHLSYWNAIFFLPAMARKWFPHGKDESDLKPIWGPLNNLMYHLVCFENSFSSKISIPFGTSVYAVVSKGDSSME